MYILATIASILIGSTCGIVIGAESNNKWVGALVAGTVTFCLLSLFIFLGV